jgi:hypothetical protein
MPGWFIEWAESVNLWGTILLISAIVGAIWGVVLFVKKGWPWLKAFARAIQKTAEVVDAVQGLPEFIARTDETLANQNDTLATQDERIAEIHHEVHYNNGSSVKDSQARTERVITDEILPALQRLADSDDELRDALENTQEPDN